MIVQHKLCECKCRLNECIFNSKQKFNHNECWWKCKKLGDLNSFGKGFMRNPSTCSFKCNKVCKIDEYLDTNNCFCGKRLICKLVLECEDETLNTTETLLNDKQ